MSSTQSLFVAGAFALVALTNGLPPAQAATITGLFDTGVDSSGVPLPDGSLETHYALTSFPGGSTNVLMVRTSAGGFPIPPYIGDDAVSAWIGPNNGHDLTGPPGDYDYRTTFFLTGSAAAKITGLWSTDNAGVRILLNGNLTANPGIPRGTDPGPYSFESFTAFTISSGFVAGPNTLDFIVNNEPVSGDNPTALRVEFTSATATPIPASLPLFVSGLGALGLLAARRKRKKTPLGI